MLQIKYNGRRFPRTLVLNGHRVKSFHKDKLVLELEDYDAYSILKSNIRLNPKLWEFNVVKVVKAKDTVEVKPEPKPEAPKAKPVETKKKKAVPPTKKTKKGKVK